MKIKIIAVGKNKENAIETLIKNYAKQIKDIHIIEIPDGKSIDDLGKEGKDVLAKIDENDFVIVLAIEGNQLSSLDFANKLENIANHHTTKITFVIGGSHGLHESVYLRADYLLSFSKMTMPHLLARLLLVEQIYRAMMILKHHPYHK